MCHEFAMSPRGRTGRRVVCAADVYRFPGDRADACPWGRGLTPAGLAGSDDGWDRMIGFLAEVHNLRRHTRDTTGARDAVPRTTPPPRARHDPAGLGSAPTPLGGTPLPGRLTAAQLELPTCRPSQCPRAPVPAISIHDTRPRLHMLLVPSRKYMLALSTEQRHD